jgi:hypothetical protein
VDKTFLLRIRPYRTVDNRLDGVVLTFMDITKIKLAQLAGERLAAIVQSSNDAIVAGGVNARMDGAKWRFARAHQGDGRHPHSAARRSPRGASERRRLRGDGFRDSLHQVE